eukprot:TRINITY_DN1274_c0_g1_i1.p1 TRINITY_DN1274_c0_g1~~TRINITY_DN1274_c0_g1_i1.p1  ORF type:complete len:433 (+),score=62.45 TRINITY_DN1274_c0_g1_i1:199-1497(+)
MKPCPRWQILEKKIADDQVQSFNGEGCSDEFMQSQLESNAALLESQTMFTYKRHLFPRLTGKDSDVYDQVRFRCCAPKESTGQLRVEFQCILSPDLDQAEQIAKLPFFYPKVKAWAFVYTPTAKVFTFEVIWFDTSLLPNPRKKLVGLAPRLLANLLKFAKNYAVGTVKPVRQWKLVKEERYVAIYRRLKSTYKHWVASWYSDATAVKYVFEDLQIAAFLIALWEAEAKNNATKTDLPYKFVDLGCGNGYLVFILGREGYKGYGVDLERRKIWDKLPEAKLIEKGIYPKNCVFSDVEWIIGNHSDELTPWIPYIASKSHHECKYFVIPCCFFDFSGRFNASDKRIGKYQTYLNYLTTVGQQCGFVVEKEVLRIPSTKNHAHIGRTRSCTAEASQEELLRLDKRREALLKDFAAFEPRALGSHTHDEPGKTFD